MQERHRLKARRTALLGPLARAEIALRSDLDLAARAAGALAGLVAAGAVAGLLVGFATGRDEAIATLMGYVVLGGLLGLVLVAVALADRRQPMRARRGEVQVYVALSLLGVAAIAGAVRLAGWSPLAAGVLGVVAAGAGAAAGLRVRQAAADAVVRAGGARRRAWHAQLRASRLTRRMIGMAAYRQLRHDGALPVKSTVFPRRTYLVPIRTTPSGARILVLEDDRPVGGLCLRPREPLPDPEEALTHILAIRTDERAWLNRANFFPQDRALTPQALGLAPGRPGNYDR